MALMVMISSKKNLQPWNTYSGGEFLVLWLIVVLVPIVVVFFVWLGSANVSLTQQLFCYDHDQQQTTLVLYGFLVDCCVRCHCRCSLCGLGS
jgi:hypothetical protein